MTESYYVFWIPSIYHVEDLKPLRRFIEEDISDDENNKHIISILLKENWDISIKNAIGTASLNYISHSRNGLISYKYEETDSSLSFIRNEIPNAVYHLIKGFFHDHEHHDAKADSLLNAFVSDKEVNIKTENNEVLLHYLKLYEKKFTAYSNQISSLYKAVQKNSKEKGKKHILFKNLESLENFCQSALGEYIYCNTLINSKYFKTECNSGNDYNDQRRTLHNIKSSIENIKLIESKNHSTYDFLCTKISIASTKIGYLIAFIALILTIIGVVKDF